MTVYVQLVAFSPSEGHHVQLSLNARCRLNMSHGDHKSHKAVVDLVKEYNKLNRNNVAIMLDTKGPEVRSGDVTEPIDMKPGNADTPRHHLLLKCACAFLTCI